MANVSQKTLHWLYNVLSKEYRDPNRAYSDIAQTLERFPTISPRTDVYTFENGSSALLVRLYGTLPVSFRNMTYRFPVEIWIPHTYPYEPPIAYITPTSEMLVRPGRHVSGEGRVYHPYLAHWATAWDRSNVVELLSILGDVFSKEPPVISRQQVGNASQQSPRPPPLPPHPHGLSQTSHNSSTQSTSAAQNSPPPPPPPPKQQMGADINGVLTPTPLGRYDAPPPLPDSARSASTQTNQNLHASPKSSSSQFTPQRNSSLRQSMTPLQFQQQQNFSPQMSSQRVNNASFSTHPDGTPTQPVISMTSPSEIRLPYRQSLTLQSEQPTQNIPYGQPQIQPAAPNFLPHPQPNQVITTRHQQQPVHPRPPPQPKPPPVNLLDSPFDVNLPVLSSANIPAPPIPPNPEKDALLSALSHSITQTLHRDMSQNAASLPLLQSQNEALNSSLRTLESEISQLQGLQGTLTGNITILQNSLREADKCISSAHARAQRGEIPKIDDMLTAPTVVGKQLYDVVCDERGIEAAIWALQAALTRGRIGVDVWARKTRELSREGFKKKVLTGKIARGMGLEE
ncbi:hypothetical protein GJ744_002710 [Endocarpon pusillum]|uniref:UEV domain-containing protein n=1 Tax=Endocarpon pusillum TaxID=364733 RepID=A0A8H7APS4_9EURO|nr:hypothetical protein GJ744_002710 [Endocarpon pusillum]